jgi:carrier-protein-independent halogenase WelO5-like protein
MDAWEVLEVPQLTHESLQALLENEVGAVVVPDLIDREPREAAYAALLEAPDWSFYEGTSPPLGRLGITQYEHYEDKDAYLAASADANARRSAVLAPLPDPVDKVVDAFDQAWPGKVGPAEEDGRPYFFGIYRRGGAGGVKIHADWGPRDGEGWAIEQITGQLAWNLFFSSPASGGELIVYDSPWEPHFEEHAGQRFSDYDPKLFESSRRVEVPPTPGALIIFNSRNAHAVASAATNGEARIAVGSFIGVTEDGDLAFWS